MILACRNEERGLNAVESIKNECASQQLKVEYMYCDLSRLDSVRAFISEYLDKGYPLHLLINNGGVAPSSSDIQFTADGIEMVHQINYLSHFLITHELLPLMIRTSVLHNSLDCRIVNTSSMAHRSGHIDIQMLQSNQQTQMDNYKGTNICYGTSKLAQISVLFF